jgi:putative ABC transport system substrate-binding protein
MTQAIIDEAKPYGIAVHDQIIVGKGGFKGLTHLYPSLLYGLRQAGYIESHNVAIEHRRAEYRYDRLPKFAEDLVLRRRH